MSRWGRGASGQPSKQLGKLKAGGQREHLLRPECELKVVDLVTGASSLVINVSRRTNDGKAVNDLLYLAA